MLRKIFAALALIAATLASLSTPTFADFKVCNYVRSPLFVSVAYNDQAKGWVSIGWWELKREGCDVLIAGSVQGTKIYVHARYLRPGAGWWWFGDVGGNWNGTPNEPLCTPEPSEQHFTIYKNEIRGSCKEAGYAERGFWNVTSGQPSDWTFSYYDKHPMTPAEEREQRPGDRFWECGDCPEMVVVPAGEFTMGAAENEPERRSEEGPRHKVTIRQAFAVSKGAITRSQFEQFVNATGHPVSDRCLTRKDGNWTPENGRSFRNPGFAQADNHPAVCLSYDDAKAYLAWLSKQSGRTYRLLTEAEWEYVTRAGTESPFWWGSPISTAQANYNGNIVYPGGVKGEFRQKTVAAYDSFKLNPWKLFIGEGNAAEWVEDCWNKSYQGAPSDGLAWTAGDCSRRIVRGGSWTSDPSLLRSAARVAVPGGDRSSDVGFRVARTLLH